MSKCTLVGYRFSPTVQEVLHTIEVLKANVNLKNVHWDDDAQRKVLKAKTPTGTFPYLETSEGIISESKAIETYLCQKCDSSLLGKTVFEQAQVRQWCDFGSFELAHVALDLVYPLFGWKCACPEAMKRASEKFKELMVPLDYQLKGKIFVTGYNFSLADIIIFNKIKFFFTLVFPDAMREKCFPNVNQWFLRLAETNEVKKVYGRILTCKVPLKAPCCEKKEEGKKTEEKKPEKKKEEKKEEKKTDPMSQLPPTTMNLEDFKRAFLNNKNKEDKMKKFWEVYDPKGYSLWKTVYDIYPGDETSLLKCCNNKSIFLQKLNDLRKYAFASYGVYETKKKGTYSIRGLWLFRGTEIPPAMKESDNFSYLAFTKLDHTKEADKKLVAEYWTLFEDNDVVDGETPKDIAYFN